MKAKSTGEQPRTQESWEHWRLGLDSSVDNKDHLARSEVAGRFKSLRLSNSQTSNRSSALKERNEGKETKNKNSKKTA